MNAVSTSWSERAAPLRRERESFAELAERHLDAVFRYLVFLTGDRPLAEDLAAETFERAFRSWRRYDPRRSAPRTWLCCIARSVTLDHLRAEERRLRREQTYARTIAGTGELAFSEGFSPELERALGRLSRAEREVVALRVLLDLDGPSAARVLGISPTACSTRLSRALQRLEETISDVRD